MIDQHCLYRALVTKSLSTVMKQVIQSIQSNLRCNEDFTFHLLKALPLLHFLRNDCVPFEPLVVQPTLIGWTDATLNLDTIRYAMYYKRGSAMLASVLWVIHYGVIYQQVYEELL